MWALCKVKKKPNQLWKHSNTGIVHSYQLEDTVAWMLVTSASGLRIILSTLQHLSYPRGPVHCGMHRCAAQQQDVLSHATEDTKEWGMWRMHSLVHLMRSCNLKWLFKLIPWQGECDYVHSYQAAKISKTLGGIPFRIRNGEDIGLWISGVSSKRTKWFFVSVAALIVLASSQQQDNTSNCHTHRMVNTLIHCRALVFLWYQLFIL